MEFCITFISIYHNNIFSIVNKVFELSQFLLTRMIIILFSIQINIERFLVSKLILNNIKYNYILSRL